MRESPSASKAVTVVIVLIFSSIFKLLLVLKIGGLSLRLFMRTEISLITVSIPSVAEIVNE